MVLPLACSEQPPAEAEDAGGDARLSVPAGLVNSELGGNDGGLTLVAFTLAPGANGAALYAAVRNDGVAPACEAGMQTDFYDTSNVLVASVGSTLQGGGLYRIEDGSNTAITCLPPGALAMTASPELPASVVIEELGHLEHQFPAFGVDGSVPLAALSVSNVKSVTTSEGHVYAGTLTNTLAVTLSQPRVAIFPLNRVGRPLGMATSSTATDLPPDATWQFATNSVENLGVRYAAYADGNVAR